LRLFSFGGYGLAFAALALVVFGAIECPSIGAYDSYPSTSVVPVSRLFINLYSMTYLGHGPIERYMDNFGRKSSSDVSRIFGSTQSLRKFALHDFILFLLVVFCLAAFLFFVEFLFV